MGGCFPVPTGMRCRDYLAAMPQASTFSGTTRFTGHKGPVYALSSDPAPGLFHSASGDGSVVCWNAAHPGEGITEARVGRAIFSLHRPCGNVLYIGDEDGGLHVVDLIQRREVQLERAHGKGIFALQELSGGRLAAAGGDGAISIWATEGNDRRIALQRKIPMTDEKVRGLALNKEGTLLAVACGDGRIHILDSTGLNEQFTLSGHDPGANCLAWHPSKPVLVSGGKDGHIRLWRSNMGFEELHAFPAHKDTIYQIAFSPDGATMASASRDKTAKLWGAASFHPLRRLDRHHGGHGYSVNTVLWLNNATLLTAGDDKCIVAWELP